MNQVIPEPVVITGASGQVGRALVAELQRCGIRSQVLVRKPAGLSHCEEYCDWMESSEAEAVLASAATVCTWRAISNQPKVTTPAPM